MRRFSAIAIFTLFCAALFRWMPIPALMGQMPILPGLLNAQSASGGSGTWSATPLGHQVAGSPSSSGTATTAAMNCSGTNVYYFAAASGNIDATTMTVTYNDGSSHAFSNHMTNRNSSGASPNVTIWYQYVSSGSSSVTVSATGSAAFAAVAAGCWSGGAPSSPLDGEAFAGPTGQLCFACSITTNGLLSGSGITPGTANELFVMAISTTGGGNSCSVDTGFAVTDQLPLSAGAHYGVCMAYLLVSGTPTTKPTVTWVSNSGSVEMGSFKP